MRAFGIFKRNAEGRYIWLTESTPFVTWGPELDAAAFATRQDAWETIGRLRSTDGAGAAVVTLT
jgi:hypothetical protein